MKKSKFLTKFQFFSPKINSFAQKLMLRKTIVTLPQSFARLDFITVLKNSLLWPKTNTFCVKWYFLPKRNNAIKIWHFSQTEDTSLRKLNISTRNEHFWHLVENENIFQYWCFCKISAYTSETQITKKLK